MQAQLEQAWHEQPRGRAGNYHIPVAESGGERERWGGPTASLWSGGSRLWVKIKDKYRRPQEQQERATKGRQGGGGAR